MVEVTPAACSTPSYAVARRLRVPLVGLLILACLFFGRGTSTIVWLAAIWGIHRDVLLPQDPAAPAVQCVLLGSSLGCLATALLCQMPSILGANLLGLAAGLMLFQLGGGLVGLFWAGGKPPAQAR